MQKPIQSQTPPLPSAKQETDKAEKKPEAPQVQVPVLQETPAKVMPSEVAFVQQPPTPSAAPVECLLKASSSSSSSDTCKLQAAKVIVTDKEDAAASHDSKTVSPTQAAITIKQKAVKTQKKKSKKHEKSAVEVQEERQEVKASETLGVEQGPASSATSVECLVEVSPALTSSPKIDCKKIKWLLQLRAAQLLMEIPILINIHDYRDGKVLPSDEDMVVIDDQCNEMLLYLFQLDEAERSNYKLSGYKPNVSRWFESARAALSEQGYLNPLSEKDTSTKRAQYKVLRIHRFNRLVDDYLPTMGIISSEQSRIPGQAEVIAITICGYVEYYDSRARLPCKFVYLVDRETGQCFHRNIVLKILNRRSKIFIKNDSSEIFTIMLDTYSRVSCMHRPLICHQGAQ